MRKSDEYKFIPNEYKSKYRCPNCSKGVMPHENYCGSCGTQIRKPKKNCSQCGTLGSGRYCTTCGNQL